MSIRGTRHNGSDQQQLREASNRAISKAGVHRSGFAVQYIDGVTRSRQLDEILDEPVVEIERLRNRGVAMKEAFEHVGSTVASCQDYHQTLMLLPIERGIGGAGQAFQKQPPDKFEWSDLKESIEREFGHAMPCQSSIDLGPKGVRLEEDLERRDVPLSCVAGAKLFPYEV